MNKGTIMKTHYNGKSIKQAKKQAVEDIKMLRGLPPYNNWGNISYGDDYFAQSIKSKYGCDDIEEIWKWANDM